MTQMQDTINKGLLIYAIQQHMFCRACKACLDVDRAVLITSWVLCGECYDANLSNILSAFQARDMTPEIIDGRKLKSVRAPK